MAEKNLTLRFGVVGMPRVLSNFTQLRQQANSTVQSFQRMHSAASRVGTVLTSASMFTSATSGFSKLSAQAVNATNAVTGLAVALTSVRSVSAGILGAASIGSVLAWVDAWGSIQAQMQQASAHRALGEANFGFMENLRKTIVGLQDAGKISDEQAGGFLGRVNEAFRELDALKVSEKLRGIAHELAALAPLGDTFKIQVRDIDLRIEENKYLMDRFQLEGRSRAELEQQLDIIANIVRERSKLSAMALEEGFISQHDFAKQELETKKQLLAIDQQRDQLKKQEIALEESNQQKLRAMRELQLRGTQEMFQNMAIAARAFGREGFLAFKAFAIASALVSTYSSAVKAYESTVGIPYVGPFIAPVAAAAAVAAGLANVAQITAQTYATGGYTGDGGRMEPAGMVHRGEFVLSAPAVDRIGVQTLDAMNRGDSELGGGMNINAAFVWSEEELMDTIVNSRAGEEWIIRTVGKNQHRFRG